MDFVLAKDFLKQSEKVQMVFLSWWKPSIGDLFNYKEEDDHDCIEVECIQSENRLRTLGFTVVIPLLTEGQLKKFIEDKAECKLQIEYFNIESEKADILFRFIKYGNEKKSHMVYDAINLLQAYWKVAVEIASQD